MLRTLFLFAFFSGYSLCSFSQQNIKERVYLHLNSRMLITGETLYYSAYCSSELTGKASNLSKFLYVELVGENGVVHQKKIALENGRGQGDLFISSLVSTGKYQLLAYTRWMKNFGDYYQNEITIINPFEEYKITKEKNGSTVEMDFYPADSNMVANIPNAVGFKISASSLANNSFKGKLVNASGENVLTINHDSFGLGVLKFTPKSSEKYQVILEDQSGQFYFFDLPQAVASGSRIQLSEGSEYIEVILGVNPEKNDVANLSFSLNGEVLLEREIKNGASNMIAKRSLKPGVIQIQAKTTNGELLSERAFWMEGNEVLNESTVSEYSTRQSITIDADLQPGTYSVSVRKTNEFINTNSSHSVSANIRSGIKDYTIDPDAFVADQKSNNREAFLLTSTLRKSVAAVDSVQYLPELREEIVTGTALNTKGEPVKGEEIAFSIPFEPFQLRVGTTDETGSFSIPFTSTPENREAYLSPISLDSGYRVTRDNPFLESYPSFDYSQPQLDSNQIREIIARSIRNQIENAYFQTEKDSLMERSWLPQIPFYYNYVLDEYTRFPTIKETFTEYIVSTSVRDRRNPIFKAYVSEDSRDFRKQPLIILDGLPVSQSKILEFSPYKIESIGILNNRYFLGGLIADGVVSFKTKEGKLGGFKLDENYLKVDLMGISPVKQYEFPDYSDEPTSHNPDQRDQLYWNPELTVSKNGTTAISFFTSDVVGLFQIVIEGATTEGAPFSYVRIVSVQPRGKS